MLLYIDIVFCALATIAKLVHAESDLCSLDPVSLPWANITLADGVAVNRGIDIPLAGQPVSLRATTMLSNCRIRNARDCGFGNATIQSGCK
jgi:hypothetical protein